MAELLDQGREHWRRAFNCGFDKFFEALWQTYITVEIRGRVLNIAKDILEEALDIGTTERRNRVRSGENKLVEPRGIPYPALNETLRLIRDSRSW